MELVALEMVEWQLERHLVQRGQLGEREKRRGNVELTSSSSRARNWARESDASSERSVEKVV